VKIETWDIERVKPCDRDPRRNDEAVDAVATSIQTYGWRQPIVVDKDGAIIVGHTRYKAALRLGLKTVPVRVAARSETTAR
jgi:ParB-like chromosome segregation protein Spo0J